MSLAQDVPTLRDLGVCAACGRRIGWVTIAATTWQRPVDVEPHPFGEYVLMRDGRRVAAPRRDPSVAWLDDRDGLEQIRYFDHDKTCPVPSLRTFAGGRSLPHSPAVFRYDGRSSRGFDDPVREERRKALLEQDRLRDLGI